MLLLIILKEVHIKMRMELSSLLVFILQRIFQKYPIIMQRTPYDCAPYGADQFKEVSHQAKR
jgi:hypothetical protein